MKLSKEKQAFLFLGVAILYFLFKDTIRLQWYEIQIENKIEKQLKEEYNNYTPLEFWTILSVDLNTIDPPYYIQHIFSTNYKDLEFTRFFFDQDLNIYRQEKESIIQFYIEETDTNSIFRREDIVFSLAKTEIEKENYTTGVLMLQEVIKMDNTFAEAIELKNKTLNKIFK